MSPEVGLDALEMGGAGPPDQGSTLIGQGGVDDSGVAVVPMAGDQAGLGHLVDPSGAAGGADEETLSELAHGQAAPGGHELVEDVVPLEGEVVVATQIGVEEGEEAAMGLEEGGPGLDDRC